MDFNPRVLVIGAGMAGAEAAWYLANRGIEVALVESKKHRATPAQKMSLYGELVCTNSLKSMDPSSAHGLLKREMISLGSLLIPLAYKCKVGAGDALAVDRVQFAQEITNHLYHHPNIRVYDFEVENPVYWRERLGCKAAIVATGPLTTPALESWIIDHISGDDFYFYDAIAPVVDADSLDTSQMYFKDRWKDDAPIADYLNIPLNKEQYLELIQDLQEADKVPAQNFEKEQFFEACLPIDLMAQRGEDTPRFGPMRPTGLRYNGVVPYAAIQLRKENLLGDAFNMVGFQTRLTYKEQLRVFRKLPGMQDASFLHLGSVHRNSYLNTPKVLNADMQSKKLPGIYFAGQMTGVEGYTESGASGLYTAWHLERQLRGAATERWPRTTAIGALVNYILTADKLGPTNVNFGLMPTMAMPRIRGPKSGRKTMKKKLIAARAHSDFDHFMEASQ